jgi:hypothetical protein
VGVRPIGRCLPGPVWPTKPASCSLLLPHLSQKYLPLTRPSHVSRRRAAVRPPHSTFGDTAISLHAPHPVLFTSRSYPSRTPTRASRSLLPQSHPPCNHPRRSLLRRRVRCPPLLMLVVPSRALGRSPPEPRASMSAPHAGGARTPRPESTGPNLPFRMLQMYVSSVLDILEVCCMCFVWMLHMLQVF